MKNAGDKYEVDMSDGIGAEMFGSLPSNDNEVQRHLSFILPFSINCIVIHEHHY